MRGIADFTSLEVVWFSTSRDVGVVWIWSSRDVRLVLHAENRRFYISRGGLVLFLERRRGGMVSSSRGVGVVWFCSSRDVGVVWLLPREA